MSLKLFVRTFIRNIVQETASHRWQALNMSLKNYWALLNFSLSEAGGD
jgi:hypothetical protein